jgi:hypothetical protein
LKKKALIQLENVQLAQAKNYLEAYNMQVGYCLTSVHCGLQIKRLENPKFIAHPFPVNL